MYCCNEEISLASFLALAAEVVGALAEPPTWALSTVYTLAMSCLALANCRCDRACLAYVSYLAATAS